jgi:hypothetical protein
VILHPHEARRRLARLQAGDPLVVTAARALVRLSRAVARGSVPHLMLGALL